MPVLAATSSRREPWKNGLGTTLVIASDATDAQGEWTWRLSIADVPSRGGFSSFPEVDRHIARLEGAGLALARSGVSCVVPDVGCALAFRGEEAVVGVPQGDGVRDVNLMLRRACWRGEMQLVRDGSMGVFGACVVVHAAHGAVEVASASEPAVARLESGETLVTHGAVEVRPLQGACAVIATMRASDCEAIPLREAMQVWAYIGVNSFGGPAAQIAVMHRVLVHEQKWISEQRFLQVLSYCMLLPGPEAMQLATYIGWLKNRTLGGLIAGIFFVLPGFFAILALSLAYTAWHDVSVVQGMLFGLRAAVLAIVAHAVIRIFKRVLKHQVMYAIAGLSFIALAVVNAPFPLIIGGAAAVGFVGVRNWPQLFGVMDGDSDESIDRSNASDQARPTLRHTLTVLAIWLALWFVPVVLLETTLGPTNIFAEQAWFFSKAAVVTFGGAYSVLAYIAQQAVEVHHWVTPAEMLTGLGMAETTPGPLIQVVQFIGYLGAYRTPGELHPLVAGVLASLLVTWVTYVPCFLWIFVGAPYVERLRESRSLRAAFAAITAAVVGVMLKLLIWLTANTLFHPIEGSIPVDWPAIAISLLAALALFRLRWSLLRTLAVAVALGAGWFAALNAM